MADEEEMLVENECVNLTEEKPTKPHQAGAETTNGNGGTAGGDALLDGQEATGKPFTLKKWNAVSMWSWDVECDTCAICRVHVMDACLRCQADNKQDDCVVVWGECNHSFHNCCMSLWVQQNNRCPLCHQDWVVQRIGK